MDGVQFENQGEEFGRPQEEKTGFDLAGMLVKWGLVPSRKEAEYALAGVAALALVGAIFFFWISGGSNNGDSTPPPNMAPTAMYQ